MPTPRKPKVNRVTVDHLKERVRKQGHVPLVPPVKDSATYQELSARDVPLFDTQSEHPVKAALTETIEDLLKKRADIDVQLVKLGYVDPLAGGIFKRFFDSLKTGW